MRVLMTGMTSRGIGSLKLKHDYVSLSDILGKALVELGHEVQIGRVLPEETLDEFDAALVLVYWVSSLSSHYVHEASLALSKLGARAAVYADDWRSQTLADDWYLHLEREAGWERHRGRFRRELWGRLTEEQVEAGKQALLGMTVSELTPERPPSPFRMLVPQHAWGDIGLWETSTRARLTVPVTPIDPTSRVPLPEVSRRSAADRDRSWVLATVQEHDRWLERQGLSWPVRRLGGAKKLGGGVNPGREEMGKVVPEREVVQAYADSWGVLVPEYACSGSGWWRPRYTFAAHAGAVVLAPPADQARLALQPVTAQWGGHPFSVTGRQVEDMDARQLSALARAQRAVQERAAVPEADFMALLDGVVRERAAAGRTS